MPLAHSGEDAGGLRNRKVGRLALAEHVHVDYAYRREQRVLTRMVKEGTKRKLRLCILHRF